MTVGLDAAPWFFKVPQPAVGTWMAHCRDCREATRFSGNPGLTDDEVRRAFGEEGWSVDGCCPKCQRSSTTG